MISSLSILLSKVRFLFFFFFISLVLPNLFAYIYFVHVWIVLLLGERILINEADQQPPHKMDENMWKNREYIEETIFLLQSSNWPEAVMYIF